MTHRGGCWGHIQGPLPPPHHMRSPQKFTPGPPLEHLWPVRNALGTNQNKGDTSAGLSPCPLHLHWPGGRGARPRGRQGRKGRCVGWRTRKKEDVPVEWRGLLPQGPCCPCLPGVVLGAQWSIWGLTDALNEGQKHKAVGSGEGGTGTCGERGEVSKRVRPRCLRGSPLLLRARSLDPQALSRGHGAAPGVKARPPQSWPDQDPGARGSARTAPAGLQWLRAGEGSRSPWQR